MSTRTAEARKTLREHQSRRRNDVGQGLRSRLAAVAPVLTTAANHRNHSTVLYSCRLRGRSNRFQEHKSLNMPSWREKRATRHREKAYKRTRASQSRVYARWMRRSEYHPARRTEHYSNKHTYYITRRTLYMPLWSMPKLSSQL